VYHAIVVNDDEPFRVQSSASVNLEIKCSQVVPKITQRRR
jgi:hypothetical protein